MIIHGVDESQLAAFGGGKYLFFSVLYFSYSIFFFFCKDGKSGPSSVTSAVKLS